MEKLVPLINEIHDILHQSNLQNQLELPYIVAIGAQSVGKSSVIESIIGKEFLPRGKGIVTRSPIEIQLINTNNNKIDPSLKQKEVVEFFVQKGSFYQDFEAVRTKIQDLTDETAGKNKAISNSPIKLRFYSPNVVDLLMVDLPGMAKNPIGDQPKDIEQQLLKMILPYVKNPNSLILAISKANDDLATSEAIKLARQVDPHGQRTIGVITQMDIMDPESDILKDLQNKTYPLKLGYVGVMCRGESDKKRNITIEQQIQIEKKFFQQHKAYATYFEKMGIPYLQKSLNLNFIHHIKNSLPNIKENILELLKVKEFDLKQYGNENIYESNDAKGLFILSLISRFCQSFKELISFIFLYYQFNFFKDGHYLKSLNEELIGGARIYYIFAEVFRKAINKIDPFEVISDREIRIAIQNSNGMQPALFIPEGAFQNLLKQQLMRLQPLSLQCSQLVFDELRRLIYTINIPEIQRFENLSSEIYQVMDQVLQKCLEPTQEMIKNLIEIELGFININHPDFLGGSNALVSIIQSLNEEEKKNEEIESKKSKEEVKISKIEEKKELNSQGGGLFGWFSSKNKVQFAKIRFLSKAEDIEQKIQQKSNYQLNQKIQQKIINNNSGVLPNFFEQNYNYQFATENLSAPPSALFIENKPSKRESIEIKTIKTLITSYFNVVKKNISDSVPKTIISMLINQIKNICERELITSLYQQELFEKLLQENEFIATCRKQTINEIKMLKNCITVLMNIDAKF